MKRFYYLILFLACFTISSAQQSYMIPDIGAPGMNIYYEIVGVYDDFGKYGNEAFYLNNEGDALRVLPANLNDTNKVVFGPISVSWSGRLISGQIFVKPTVEPNTWDWSILANEFKIPIQIIKDGSPLANENHIFYLVRPFPFGDKRGNPERILGQGSLGKRSPRGAMIVDEMRLAGERYTVSTLNSDPDAVGNQGYLPFVLLAKGNIIGENGAIISVNASGRNAGPGGGGGGGRFADNSSGTAGGDGFTGGGNGGVNSSLGSNSYENPGNGTGRAFTTNLNGRNTAGYSLNGVPGAVGLVGGYESSGGGTGHPFGLSGAAGWVPCTNCEGGYGGGSGNNNNGVGGSGGYSTNAENEGSVTNGGKSHGNRYGIPIAGGSGGGGGNPQGIVTQAGAGGGAGGAIRIFALNIENIRIEANGADGESRSPKGGAGSGGYVEIGTKDNISNITISAARGSNRAGYGRIRSDARNNAPIIAAENNDPSQVTTTIATQSTEFVERNFSFMVKKNQSEVMDYYLKPENGEWFKLFTFDEPLTTKMIDVDLTAFDANIFYGMAVQSTEYVGNEANHEQIPELILSQSSGNIFEVAEIELFCEQPRLLNLSSCNEQIVYDSVWVKNNGRIFRAYLYIEEHTWDAGDNGFDLLLPTVNLPIEEADSQRFFVSYNFTPGQMGLISNTLTIPFGKNSVEKDGEFKIEYIVDVSNLDISWHRQDGDEITGDTLFTEICIGDSFTESLSIQNNSNIDFTLESIEYARNDNGFTNLVFANEVVQVGARENFQIGFSQTPLARGTFYATIYTKVSECAGVIDSLVVAITVKEAFLEQTNGLGEIDFGDVNIVLNKEILVTIVNTGNAPAYIPNAPVLNPEFEIISSSEPFPMTIQPNQEVEFLIRFSPTSVGGRNFSFKLEMEEANGGCEQDGEFRLLGNGIESNLIFPFEIDWEHVQWCHSRPDSTIEIRNNANFPVTINGSHTITGINPENWEITQNIPQNGNIIAANGGIFSFDIRYNAQIGDDGPKSAILKIPTDDVSLPTEGDPNKHLIIIELKAFKEGLDITVNPDPLIDFDRVPINTESIRIPVEITNNSTVLTRTLNQIIPGNFRMYGGVNQTFAPGETKTIEVTVNIIEEGIYQEDFHLIFDSFGSQNCTATYSLEATAFGIKGETEFEPSELDFGILNKCEVNQQLPFSLTNVGEVPTTLVNFDLEGNNPNYFSFENYTANDGINENETKDYTINFNPPANTYGVFDANIKVNLIENNNDISYNIPVKVEVSKGVLTNPIEIDFGPVISTRNSQEILQIQNQHNWVIDFETFNQVNTHFPTFEFDNLLLSNNNLTGTRALEITFTPPAVGEYEDTLYIPYLIDGTCEDTVIVVLRGTGLPASEMRVFIENQQIDPTLNLVEIPIFAEIVSGVTDLPSFSIDNFVITMDKTTFQPIELSIGDISSISYPEQDKLAIEINIEDVEIGEGVNQISSIIMVPLLGERRFSEIQLDNLVVREQGIFSNFIYQSASVELIICDEGGDRLLKNNQDIVLTLSLSYSNLDISGNIIEAGYNQIDIVSIDGRTLYSANWIREKGGANEFEFKIDLNKFSNGLYLVRLITPNDIITQKIIINK